MPPGKRSTPPPIDRPLSKAYLREFTGWSCAYPPGISDPTTMRDMANVMITREGAAAIRPALRSVFKDDFFYTDPLVGEFEPFYSQSGKKCLLYATRSTVGGTLYGAYFRVAIYNSSLNKFEEKPMTDPDLGFTFDPSQAAVAFGSGTTYVKYVQIDNKIFALSNAGETLREFHVGSVKQAIKPQTISRPAYNSTDRLILRHPDDAWVTGAQVTVPNAETPTATTLVADAANAAKNQYNFAYFYTFSNTIGETAPSMVSVIKVQRPFDLWQRDLSDDSKSLDQLAAIIPQAAYDAAKASGAISWNLYGFNWTDQAPVPVEGILLRTTSMVTKPDGTGVAAYATNGWATQTPALEGTDFAAPLPSPSPANRVNYSTPSTASNGLVAGDRLTLVGDKLNPAVIRWTAGTLGNYTNFSANLGGGYKTLTTGNLMLPAAVKLWQNPQSVDTITILCIGTDGYHASYYMSPNTAITAQSSTTTIMGFEETTATPGTVSPYGNEVINNALYHPLDWALVKSTAQNYNISHKTMSDMIQPRWLDVSKRTVISSQLDNRLYLIVNNTDSNIAVPSGCNGNEIWVFDTAGGEKGTWSRFLIPAVSLKKLEVEGRLYMCVIGKDSFYILDDQQAYDTFNKGGGLTGYRPIYWTFETNTQGANRAHDAWCNLQQMNITVGNFLGTIEYGIIGHDVNGKPVRMSKVFRSLQYVPSPHMPKDLPLVTSQSDLDDFFLIRRTLKEWRLWASAVVDPNIAGQYLPSYGQISLVQYRYTPISVNVGYEFGSVETFEYGRDTTTIFETLTENGVPKPYIDTQLP